MRIVRLTFELTVEFNPNVVDAAQLLIDLKEKTRKNVEEVTQFTNVQLTGYVWRPIDDDQ